MKNHLRATQNQSSIQARNRFRRFASSFPKWRLFVHLIVHADESGHHDITGQLPGSGTPVVAGIAGSAKQWERFYGDWQRILNAYSIRSFHFAEWNSAAAVARGARQQTSKDRSSPYVHLSRERLDKLLRAVCKLIGSVNFVFIGGSVFIKVAPNTATSPTPLHEVAEAFFNRMVMDIRSGRPNWNDTINVIFDEPDNTFRHIVTDAFYKAKQQWPQLKELTFGSQMDNLGIQAADVLAYRLRQHFQNYSEDGLDLNIKDNDKLLLKRMFQQFQRHGFEGPFLFPNFKKPKK